MELIKIELDDKTYKIPKPKTFEELYSRLSSKFGRQEIQRRLMFYRDSENDEVAIESETDFQVAFRQPSEISKLSLKPLARQPEEESACLRVEDLGSLCKYLGSLVDQRSLKKVEKCFDQNLLPCPACIREGSEKRDRRGRSCFYCDGKGGRPLTKIWNFILFLIDYQIKQHILNPILELGSEKSASNLKEEDQEKNSTKISLGNAANDVLLEVKTANNRNPPDIPKKGVQSMPKAQAYDDSQATKFSDFSSVYQSWVNEKTFKKQKTFVGRSTDLAGVDAKQINLSFPNHTPPNAKREDLERIFTKEPLLYEVLEAEAWLSNSNTVAVRLMIQSVQNKSWPRNVRIRGKDCELTKNVEFKLEKPLRALSMIGIKFNFAVKGDLTESIMRDDLRFEFVANDYEKNIKYVSEPLTLRLNLKKSSKLNICSIVK